MRLFSFLLKTFGNPLYLLAGLLFTFLLAANTTYAQDDPDTLIVEIEAFDTAKNLIIHSPQRATLYSMVLPGLGQAYNKKYWKIPIVYAGFGVLGYFISMNRSEFVRYREAYDYLTIGDQSIPIDNEYAYKYTTDQLLQGRDYYRRNLEFTYILTGVWYLLNVLDAVVDAHLFDYDVSDDLSIRFKPVIENSRLNNKVIPSASLTFRF
ncbi:MAG: DUF5683 domain-containing protein [Candidatus Cloacimonadales bacterium]